MLLTLKSTTPGGKVFIIGMGNPIQTLPISQAAHREIDLIGVFRYTRDSYRKAIELLKEQSPHGPDFMSLVTHRFNGFEGIEKAFETAAKPVDLDGKLVLKVLIDFEN
jgi:L-iditol 2-dehydrogenase